MTTEMHTVLNDRLLDWIKQAAHPQATVREITQLHGGMSSIVHSILLEIGNAEVKVVLRQFNNADWLRDEPDLPLHEAENLRWADKIEVKTPSLTDALIADRLDSYMLSLVERINNL